ncbi:Dcp1-like decapping [Artemisia annua]|uniref:Dcp1-like decapping n=1 Tax=Artemisia annua TaxID=35608 RepID=A0A2U1KNZ5_ARTAN|nr:Dcp1-like decapping [Artemisia annua]
MGWVVGMVAGGPGRGCGVLCETVKGRGEFEELEAVPTSAVIEGPLEPGLTSSRTTDVPEDSSFVNFFSNAMNLGHNNVQNPVNSIPSYHNSTVPLASRDIPSPMINGQPLPNPSSTPPMPHHDNVDLVNSSNHLTNLIKPLSFFTPSSSSSPLMRQPSSSVPVTTLQPPLNVQRNVGIPLLQPFPPPTPPPSLTPSSTSAPFYGPLTREKVRDALVLLSQEHSAEVPVYSNESKKYRHASLNFCNIFVFFIENLVENLLGDFEFELQVPYLLYRNASQEVNGIWFYNTRECEDVANLFTRILGAYSKVPPKQQVNKRTTNSSTCSTKLYRKYINRDIVEETPHIFICRSNLKVIHQTVTPTLGSE